MFHLKHLHLGALPPFIKLLNFYIMSIKVEINEYTNEMLVKVFTEFIEKIEFLSSELDGRNRMVIYSLLNNILNCHYSNIEESINNAIIFHLEQVKFEENE